MKFKDERGFSIIELVLVCVVIAIIATIAIPYLQQAVRASETTNTYATMRTISSTQMSFFSQNSRFGRLVEINNLLSSGIGTQSGSEINRGKYVFAMTPPVPTDSELRESYTITATSDLGHDGVIYVYELTESGDIRRILP